VNDLPLQFGQRPSIRLKLLILFSTVVLVYCRSFWNEYAFDDLIHIVNNPAIQTWSGLFSAALNPIYPGDLFRPITVLSNGFIRILCGTSAMPHHIANVALHAANSVLVSLILIRFNAKYPLLLALLWAVLPIHLEVVTNCTGRAELLSFFCGLAGALLLFSDSYRSRVVLLISTFLLALSFGAKESGIVWCFTPLLLSTLLFKKIDIRYAFCCVVPIMVLFALRYWAFQGLFGSSHPSPLDNPLIALPLYERILFSLALLGRYACITFLPISPGADYSWGYFYPNTSYYYLAAYLTLLCALVWSTYSSWIRNHPCKAGLTWFFLAFAPTANILFPIGTIFGERLGYSPSLGLIVSMSTLILSSRSLRFVALFIVASTVTIIEYTPVWKNNENLYIHQKVASPHSVKTKVNLAVIERNKGHTTRAERLLTEALSTFPEYGEAQFNLAYIAFLKGNTVIGHQLLAKALVINPNLPDALNLAGRLALNENRLPDAFSYFKRLIDSYPYSVDGHIGLLAIAINSGDSSTANRLLSRLDDIAPGNTEVASLRNALK
jgi:hypothetical protein